MKYSYACSEVILVEEKAFEVEALSGKKKSVLSNGTLFKKINTLYRHICLCKQMFSDEIFVNNLFHIYFCIKGTKMTLPSKVKYKCFNSAQK